MSEFGNRTRDIPLINDEVERLRGVIEYQKKEILLLKRHLFELERQLAEKNAE
jgi:hypothetical protein